MSDSVEKREDGFQIRKKVDFNTEMIKAQQEALLKTVKRYERRDNPIEQLIESAIGRSVDLFLKVNEQIVNAIPDDTRMKLEKAWHDFLLAF
ncbi:MAG: hypothetical protein ACTSYF_11460 [Promethearchaeota archaeon]